MQARDVAKRKLDKPFSLQPLVIPAMTGDQQHLPDKLMFDGKDNTSERPVSTMIF